MAATGSGAEAIAGAGALVLAVLGLAGTFPMILAAITVIAAGAAFLFQGAALAPRYRRLAYSEYLQRFGEIGANWKLAAARSKSKLE